MNWKSIMSKAPNGVIAVCVTVFMISVIGAFTLLALKGGDATELRGLINTLVNVATLFLTGTATVVAGAAARSADQAARQTNGELDGRISAAVETVLKSRDSEQR